MEGGDVYEAKTNKKIKITAKNNAAHFQAILNSILKTVEELKNLNPAEHIRLINESINEALENITEEKVSLKIQKHYR